MDRQRPRDEPFVGAIVPFAQRYLPSRGRLDAARPEGLVFLRRGARARGPRRLVRSRSRDRPALAETLEQHREGRAAPDTDQDRARSPQRRQELVDRLVRYNPVGQGRPTRRCVLGFCPERRAKSGLVAEAARAKATRGSGRCKPPDTSSATESRPADGRGSPWHR